MMDLPTPASRKPIHTRRLVFEAYARDDSLWDIDCELVDAKPFPSHRLEHGLIPPGAPVHLLRMRLTIDDAYTIHDVQAASLAVPFDECHVAADRPMMTAATSTMRIFDMVLAPFFV